MSRFFRTLQDAQRCGAACRYTVGKITPEKYREIRASDFKAQMSQRFPPNGSSTTPPHRSHDFKWKDYCPMVFRCAANVPASCH